MKYKKKTSCKESNLTWPATRLTQNPTPRLPTIHIYSENPWNKSSDLHKMTSTNKQNSTEQRKYAYISGLGPVQNTSWITTLQDPSSIYPNFELSESSSCKSAISENVDPVLADPLSSVAKKWVTPNILEELAKGPHGPRHVDTYSKVPLPSKPHHFLQDGFLRPAYP